MKYGGKIEWESADGTIEGRRIRAVHVGDSKHDEVPPGEQCRCGWLNLGLVRDSVLNGTNNLQLFMEEWLGMVRPAEVPGCVGDLDVERFLFTCAGCGRRHFRFTPGPTCPCGEPIPHEHQQPNCR